MLEAKLSCLRRFSLIRRMRMVSISVAIVALALAFTGTRTAHLNDADTYAIKDAQIVTGTGKTISKGTVVIRNGLIADVGENARIPADARIIEGAGMVVYPGFIDGYTNLGIPAPPQQPAPPAGGGRQAALAAAAANPQQQDNTGDPSLSAAEQVKPGGTGVEDARNAGITAALSSPKQGIFAGQSALINLAGDDASHLVLRAPVALTVQFTTGSFFGGNYPGSLMGTVAFIRQSFYDAIHYRDEVERYNRIKRGVQRPQNDKKLAALQPVIRGEMPVIFIANTDLDIRRALMIADEFKLKPIIGGGMYGYRVASMLKAKNVPVILSVDFPARPNDLPEDEDEPLRVLRDRAEAPKAAAMLAQAGIKFAFTSGALRPSDFLNSVRRAVENGLSKDEAVRALTSNAAEIFGVSEQLGTIETGKIANLVVMSGDLFSRDSRPRHVFIDGNEYEVKREAPQQRPGGFRGGQGAPVADPSGDWDLTVKTPQGDLSAKLSIKRDGATYSGTLTSPMGTVEVKEVSVSGNQLRATLLMPASTGSETATLSCTIEGTTMRGTISIGTMGAFDFTGTKPKTEGL